MSKQIKEIIIFSVLIGVVFVAILHCLYFFDISGFNNRSGYYFSGSLGSLFYAVGSWNFAIIVMSFLYFSYGIASGAILWLIIKAISSLAMKISQRNNCLLNVSLTTVTFLLIIVGITISARGITKYKEESFRNKRSLETSVASCRRNQISALFQRYLQSKEKDFAHLVNEETSMWHKYETSVFAQKQNCSSEKYIFCQYVLLKNNSNDNEWLIAEIDIAEDVPENNTSFALTSDNVLIKITPGLRTFMFD